MSKKDVRIGLVTVSATLGKQEEVGKRVNAQCESLFRKFKAENLGLVTSLKEAAKIRSRVLKSDLIILSVATGGTERLICDICGETDALIILHSTFSDNSLASCLEAFSKLKRAKENIRLVLEKNEKGINKVDFYAKIISAIKKLEDSRLGVIGGSSTWLVSTTKNRQLIKEKLGVKTVEVNIDDLLDMVNKISEGKAKKHFQEVMSKFDRIIEPKNEEILEAIRIYLAIKRLVEEKNLSAATVKCFDLIEPIKNTACLALSLLNDEGTVAGCEGDTDSALTMMIVKNLTDKPAFMANLNDVDLEENTVTFAHCTAATTLCKRCTLRSHFESKIGVSIQGVLPLQKVTVCRIGENLGKMLICTGKTRENLNNPNMCRTQIKVKLDARVKDLVSNTLGNHHILSLGDHREELTEFCKLKNIMPILLDQSP